MTSEQTETTLNRLYKLVPRIECKGLCADSCGPIAMTQSEWQQLNAPDTPHETGEGMVMIPDLPTVKTGKLTCPLLANGRCTVYANRPLICRLWGVVETLKCPHGCRPKKYLRHGEGHTLLRMAAQKGDNDHADRS